MSTRKPIEKRSTEYKGVCYHRDHRKYKASVQKDKVVYACGYFDTPREAAVARDMTIVRLNLDLPLQILKPKVA